MSRIQQDFIVKAGTGNPDWAVECPIHGFVDETTVIPNPLLPSDGWNLLCSFQNNSPSTTTFDPIIMASSGEYAWDLGDGTIIIGDKSISHTYLSTATRTVKLYGRGTCNITSVVVYSDSIIGIVDLSNGAFSTLTAIDLSYNASITGLVLPENSTAALDLIAVNNTNFTGSLDLSSYSSFSTAFKLYFQSCANLTGITFPANYTGAMSSIYGYSTGFTGSLDLSKFDFNSNCTLNLYSNPNLTGVLLKSTATGNINMFAVQNCNITGTLDLSMLRNFIIGASIIISGNPNLTSVLFSDTDITGSLVNVSGNNCNITGNLDASHLKTFYKSGPYNYPSLLFHNNINLTGVTLPSVISGPIEYINFNSCNLTGTLDLRPFREFGEGVCDITVNQNPNLTNILFYPIVTKKFRYLSAQFCNLSSVLDLSMFDYVTTGLRLLVNDNPNLPGITFSNTITTGLVEISVNNTGLTGELDLTKFPQMYYVQGTSHGIYTSYTQISSLKIPTTGKLYFLEARFGILQTVNFANCAVGMFDVANCKLYMSENLMSSANVNKILTDLNTKMSSGFAGRNIYLGGDNAPPSSNDGGYDGIAAKIAIAAKSITVSATNRAAAMNPTVSANSITQTTAISGGDIIDEGGSYITARGICWSTNINPTIANSKTTDGTGAGMYASILSGLTPNTIYYVRSYATNSYGTAYGAKISFTTLP